MGVELVMILFLVNGLFPKGDRGNQMKKIELLIISRIPMGVQETGGREYKAKFRYQDRLVLVRPT